MHLDFHTGPDIPDVGRDFDPATFARAFKEAHVDSVTVFAKCHHGHLYYGTERPERHPGLAPGHDQHAQQVLAPHAAGHPPPLYQSQHVDEKPPPEPPAWLSP
ncbi:hypothetical protein, partial [Kitasatospora sp. NPDC093558]|uniref:hypothetical protein n=1 Tax=Kitasatospora sp. NPDC093558 TaxID=3155201 RepID=UPI00343E3366